VNKGEYIFMRRYLGCSWLVLAASDSHHKWRNTPRRYDCTWPQSGHHDDEPTRCLTTWRQHSRKLEHQQTSSSSTYQPPVWLALFSCICCYSLELAATHSHSVRFCESPTTFGGRGNTLKHFIFKRHSLMPDDPYDPILQPLYRFKSWFWRFMNSFRPILNV